VRRGAEADDGAAGFDVVGEVLHLVVRQVAEPGGDDHQVGRVEGGEAGDVVIAVRVDGAVVGDGEQDDALEAVAGGGDFGELGQGLLGAVFLVAADQDDGLALAGAVAAGVDDPGICGAGGEGGQGQDEQRGAGYGVHGAFSPRRPGGRHPAASYRLGPG